MKYLLFLDIDGVLTSSRVDLAHNSVPGLWSRFDPVAIDFLNYLHDEFEDVSIVISSTWRKEDFQEKDDVPHWVVSAFRSAGFRGNFATPWRTISLDGLFDRAHEVKRYLEQNPPVDYLVFDDNGYNFNTVLGRKRFVKTDPNNGMLFSHMVRARELANNWAKK